jgi:RNA polymerase sigma-70 factor (ECF subfamily)
MNKRREFELAVQAYSDDLYRYAYWLSRHPKDAEDLVQECFCRAWKSWPDLKDCNAVKKWLFVILRREFLRRVGKQPDMDDLEDAMELPYVSLAMDDVQTIRRLLHEAPDNLSNPLLLQVLGGFSCEEIAELETTTVGAVMARLSRARKWFRSRLDSGISQKAG